MDPKQNMNTTPSTQSSSDRETMIKFLQQSGAKQGHKTGSILMPVSKKMREAMERSQQPKV